MALIGVVATAIGALVAIVVVALGVRSIPDLARYRRLRKM